MKLVGLFLALAVMAMMGVMLTTMSAYASAQLSSSTKTSLLDTSSASAPAMTSELSTSFTQQATKNNLRAPRAESSRKSARKRLTNRCARVTTPCWRSA